MRPERLYRLCRTLSSSVQRQRNFVTTHARRRRVPAAVTERLAVGMRFFADLLSDTAGPMGPPARSVARPGHYDPASLSMLKETKRESLVESLSDRDTKILPLADRQGRRIQGPAEAC
jgi:hypothetical protein